MPVWPFAAFSYKYPFCVLVAPQKLGNACLVMRLLQAVGNGKELTVKRAAQPKVAAGIKRKRETG